MSLLSIEVLRTDVADLSRRQLGGEFDLIQYTYVTHWLSYSPGGLLGSRTGGRRGSSWLALRSEVLASHRPEDRKCSMHRWNRGIHFGFIRGAGLV